MPLKPLSNEELAYIAGIFDGEGCVGLSKTKTSYFIRVLVVNTNRSLLEYLQSCFGGDIHPMQRKVGWKQSWQWRLSWSKAIEFLNLIEPWLRVKEDQAHIAFCWDHFRVGGGNGAAHRAKAKESRDVYEYLRECLTFCNKRGEHNLIDPIDREFRSALLSQMEVAGAVN